MSRRFLMWFVALFFAVVASAEEQADTTGANLIRRFHQLLNTDRKEEFYQVSERLQQMYKENGNLSDYYSARNNEIIYDANHGEAYKAIKKANDMLEDMKNDGVEMYDYVYVSLGKLFESRGSYRMAMHYYQEALDHLAEAKDSTKLSQIYILLAAVNITHDTSKAWYWNERLGTIINSPFEYKVYLLQKGQIFFFNKQKEKFLETKREMDVLEENLTDTSNTYGNHMIKIMESALLGKYDEALRLLDQNSKDYDDVKRCDIRIKIYELMGLNEMALKEVNKRRDLRDSLNNELLFSNINEINTAAGVNMLHEKAAQEREMWQTAVIALLLIAFGLGISRYFVRQRYQKRIFKQNAQLEIALDEAKESEHMKNIFIQHISHEIRTPLNIITGYAQVITNPAFELGTEERNKMLQAIGKNTIAITDIVNDLLEISQEESKERYCRNDHIAVNDFCLRLMKDAEARNLGRLELKFQTALPDSCNIQSNQSAIERILQHLLSNAMKFTERGSIELAVFKSTNGSTVSFTVTDTGVGIPEDQHEQVFEHFYKVDSFKQGLGIGLSMSRKIAILLGGTLVIDKNYHSGTRMILTIPAK